MLGVQQIINMRREGYKPKSVFVQAGFVPLITCRFDDPDRGFESKQYPEVWISPDEMGTWLDLRFLLGCQVLVHSETWSEEVLRLLDRMAEMKPIRIVASANENGDLMIYENENWSAYANP